MARLWRCQNNPDLPRVRQGGLGPSLGLPQVYGKLSKPSIYFESSPAKIHTPRNVWDQQVFRLCCGALALSWLLSPPSLQWHVQTFFQILGAWCLTLKLKYNFLLEIYSAFSAATQSRMTAS